MQLLCFTNEDENVAPGNGVIRVSNKISPPKTELYIAKCH